MLGVPTSVEKYELLEEIGRGGMATVYRARDQRLDRYVALKVMHPHLQGAKEARARFAREAKTIARLRHPGLLEIFDYSGEDSEVSFIATELLTGPTVRRFCDEHPEIPAELAACMALQVAEALGAAHQAGVIHRDVKPENIMMHEGRLKLTDFGIAQLVDAQGMTTTGQVLGSPGHMAPEQVEGKDCTARSDIFALGTVLYLLATGELPFAGRNPHQVLKQIVEGQYRDPLLVRPAVGQALGAIIERCLALDPQDRYASADELIVDLRGYLEEMQIEEPDVLLSRYLADPEAFVGPFRERVVARLSALGDAAMAADDYPGALGFWNRALSLDEGNAHVLAALQGLSQRARRKRLVRGAAWTAGLLALLAGLFVVLGPRLLETPTALESDAKPAATSHTSSATLPPSPGGEIPMPTAEIDAGVDSDKGPDAAAAEAADASTKRAVPARPPRPRFRPASARRGGQPAVDPHEPRTVVFKPTPANVAIAVDGGPARAYGPSFRSMKLTPGEHTFSMQGAHDCCVDETFTLDIPPGSGAFPLVRKLAFRPAGLYVVTDAPANVLVDDRISGRTRSVLQVPHADGLLETHTVVVSAAGYARHEQQVQLQAGQLRTIQVTLTAVPRAQQ